jgi:predicted transcriptional regulator
MATSVKVDEDTKERLERLQAEIKLQTGRKVTQQELLDRLVARGTREKATIIESFRDEWDGLSDAGTERFLADTSASGDPVDEEDIDAVLYDDEAAPGPDG